MSNIKDAESKQPKSDNTARESFSKEVLRYLYLYTGGVGVLILAASYLKIFGHEIFSDAVLMALIGSTVLTAIGLVGFVILGLLPKK